MTAPSEAGRIGVTAILQIATGIGIMAFWLTFFTVGLAPANPGPCFFAFEHAFPPPDLVLAAALMASGWDILRSGSWGRTVALASAGGLIFLGIIDVSFTVQSGGFSGPWPEVLGSLAISLWCTGFGVWMILVHHAAAGGDRRTEAKP